MFNVELTNRTTRTVIAQRQVPTEPEVAQAVKMFEGWVADMDLVTSTSSYDVSPRGYARGITLYTADGEFDITTARM